MSRQIDLFENINIIKIDNDRQTVTVDGKEYDGEAASTCAWLIRLGVQELRGEQPKEQSRMDWGYKMIKEGAK